MKKQSLILAGSTLLVGLSAITGAGVVHAATNTTRSSGTSIVQKIANKFGLKQAEVQAVFDQDHSEHRAHRIADTKTRLDQAVKDGKLTQVQEDHIIQVQKEIHDLMGTKRPDEQDQTTRDKIKAKIDELKKWATDNNVDEQYVHSGNGRHGRFGGPRGN